MVITRGADSGNQSADSESAQDLPERRLLGGFQGEILHGDAKSGDAYKLGSFKAFTGQDDHLRHEAFLHPTRIS